MSVKDKYRNLPIRQKLHLIIMATVCTALMLACGAVLIYDHIVLYRSLEKGVSVLAEIFASNTAAALTFDDPKAAQELLSSLRARPSIETAIIYSSRGEIFASYRGPGVGVPLPAVASHKSAVWSDESHLQVLKPILQGQQPIGSIYIACSTEVLRQQLKLSAEISLAILVAAALLALGLASRLLRWISEPIRRLAETARLVSTKKDYTARAAKLCDDDLGQLTDTFNGMLVEIESRDAELIEYQDHLEGEVARRTAELVESRDKAEASSRAKSEFLANMSHEIRTPMNGVIGMTELAMDLAVSDEQRDYLNTVRTSGESLLNIINDVLDFSKIEAGRFTLESCEFIVDEILREVLRMMAVGAQDKGLELLYDNRVDLPEVLLGDPGRLRQVVVNLLGNAVKFTAAGEIILSILKVQPSDHGLNIHFSISDTGIGIPPEWRDRIFGAFVQADGSHTRQYGGTGLGLTISSRLVGMMGGRIWLESELGSGSTFHFTVDFGVPQEARAAEPIPQPEILRDLAVLVVDENAASRRILHDTLARWNMRPILAESSEQARELALRHTAAGDRFALVLLDAQFPHVHPAPAVPEIVMLSSIDLHSLNPELRQTGRYVTKPVTRPALLKALLQVFENRSPEASDRRPVSLACRPAARALHILLAEDNAVNQKVVARLLEKQGHSVVIAGNGQEALAAFAPSTFDLILMDVQMPVMDGYQAAREIRAREQHTGRHVPIIALTAHALKGDREICLQSGMDDYLAKPVRIQELIAILEHWGKHLNPNELPDLQEKL